MQSALLVLGIGNTLLSDEGAGLHAIRCLEAGAAPPGRLPVRRALVGIQPYPLDWGSDPRLPVWQVNPVTCTLVHDLIQRWRA